ncbi:MULTISPECIES: competence/damage-inducible protein A [Kosmotoga]|uniref:CinA-like protein n=1 Tax=Kosmotoga olearia (strain ATCC BAA-1733 / DSM 21960 / TBF 19.5.1) TaxID=521045 RepID=CINAL_KOSOT|nr:MULTISPECIES: competence/damage-inducible protein A [Kosmotoga]C5CFW1.1 RecName: Full=CinA-like protein [Kosmotoga olearia TBF 19.5.1]ACR80455.1 competence/damage-inducible protein CinA [Kosmotoga olearia TBF 19.5.1]OAA19374.1 damage-inducible protein CinA [Kosmotoga sp. DU53]
MKAEIISVGTELLLGDILNTNAQYLSKKLAELGIFLYRQTVVGDNMDRILQAFDEAFKRSELVITTGGLGPTQDDLTKEAAAKFFSKKLVLHKPTLQAIKDYFKGREEYLTEGNLKQAYIPEGAIVLDNFYGTAPGCIIEDSGKILIILPGPPKEMEPMFETAVMPYLMKLQNCVLYSKVLRVFGMGECLVVEKIKEIIENQDNPTIAPYAKEGEVLLRITARADNKELAEGMIAPIEKQIREKLGEYIYGVGEESLEEIVVNLLRKTGLTISTAESCTGGLVASKIVNVAGVSKVFMEGIIAYSNEAKVKRLGVKKETLSKFGAVSEETAIEMASGIAKSAGTDIGLSITGIAGPTGGTPEKPVGLVYLGLYVNGKTAVKKLQLGGDRNKIRNRAAMFALDFVRRALLPLV